MAATPVRSLARWRRRRGVRSQLPKAEVVLFASFAQNGAGSTLLLHNINSPLQPVPIHAALGGGWPRWQPLNDTDRHATPYGRDTSRRVSWQADTATAAYTVATGRPQRLSIGWGAAGGGNGGVDRLHRRRTINLFVDDSLYFVYSAF